MHTLHFHKIRDYTKQLNMLVILMNPTAAKLPYGMLLMTLANEKLQIPPDQGHNREEYHQNTALLGRQNDERVLLRSTPVHLVVSCGSWQIPTSMTMEMDESKKKKKKKKRVLGFLLVFFFFSKCFLQLHQIREWVNCL